MKNKIATGVLLLASMIGAALIAAAQDFEPTPEPLLTVSSSP